METPEWYQEAVEAVKEGRVRKINLREEKFTLREWLWGISAYLRFWNKQFHLPYQGLTARKALILMWLRGERPITVEEALKDFAKGFLNEFWLKELERENS